MTPERKAPFAIYPHDPAACWCQLSGPFLSLISVAMAGAWFFLKQAVIQKAAFIVLEAWNAVTETFTVQPHKRDLC